MRGQGSRIPRALAALSYTRRHSRASARRRRLMNPTEAAALAVLGNRDRRLIAAILRVLDGRATSDDLEWLPPRGVAEPLIAWACRCRAGGSKAANVVADADAECRRLQTQAEQQ